MIDTIDKEGKYLQTKIFSAHDNEEIYWYEDCSNKQTLNSFLRSIDSSDLHSILPIGGNHSRILILYYTDLEICNICSKFIDELGLNRERHKDICKCKKEEEEPEGIGSLF